MNLNVQQTEEHRRKNLGGRYFGKADMKCLLLHRTDRGYLLICRSSTSSCSVIEASCRREEEGERGDNMRQGDSRISVTAQMDVQIKIQIEAEVTYWYMCCDDVHKNNTAKYPQY